jgi:hypothetical protein
MARALKILSSASKARSAGGNTVEADRHLVLRASKASDNEGQWLRREGNVRMLA